MNYRLTIKEGTMFGISGKMNIAKYACTLREAAEIIEDMYAREYELESPLGIIMVKTWKGTIEFKR